MLPLSSTAAHFEPKFYTDGPTRFYLPLFHDLISLENPGLVVTLGPGDGQAHFAMCQTVAEKKLSARIVSIRRGSAAEPAVDDPAWQSALKVTAESFPDISQLIYTGAAEAAATFAAGSVDVLFIDDVDSGETARNELEMWRSKLSPHALVLLHGTQLERIDAPRTAWVEFIANKATAEFSEGIGLGVATAGAQAKMSPFRAALFEDTAALAQHYQIVAELMKARVQKRRAEARAHALEARQTWFDTIVEDRAKAQAIIEHQERLIADSMRKLEAVKADYLKAEELLGEPSGPVSALARRFAILHRDRAVAQGIMENQFRQIQSSQAKIAELKKIIATAKAACRKKGRCFDKRKAFKPRRSVGERVVREFARIPRNLFRMFSPSAAPPQKKTPAILVEKHYLKWIAQHEATSEDLAAQKKESAGWQNAPRISLLVPVFNTPAKFLDELFASICRQSYDQWEACVVDGGSSVRATLRSLRRWANADTRIRVQRLQKNFGISENTNRALNAATGDFVTLVDHDDLLAPFALYELASAIRCHPAAEIFYSDEDRLRESGERIKPFFKPEWSPELLLSFMYIGHLTAYRREFAVGLGGFRKEFDLSQDYDLALRATERARQIVHIPHVLYHWREHAASGAAGGKPEARKTNLAALVDAVKRRGLDAEVLEYPTANRVRMLLRNKPSVSVIIPTDSSDRAQKCVGALARTTDYPDAEFIIVTNTALIEKLADEPIGEQVRFVAFDAPFNFSAKCNAGARAANGKRLIFVNDDVETNQRDWIENLIEPLENPEIGAVAPKLLYATGRIQHAGLVTGVRGLVGTAAHQWPANSIEYSNFTQSMRTVSALSAACLAMRRDDFFRVGGFDEVHTPIAHSDLDLCFKIRDAGMRCIYTPFATLTHSGHLSIGAEEQNSEAPVVDKSSIFLLRRWATYTCHDPFYPDHMRDWLYRDSPEPIRMFARKNSASGSYTRDILFVTHELTLSGAPIILAHLAKWCKAHGIFVVAMSPADGPLRETFVEADIPIIVEPLLATGYDAFAQFGQGQPIKSHKSFTKFARDFDAILANTIFAAPLIHHVRSEVVPNIWWIHEGLVGAHFLKKYPLVAGVLGLADLIITPDEGSRRIYQPFAGHPVRVLPHGIPDLAAGLPLAPKRRAGPLRFLLLGTIEHRKGQQTLLEALRQLSPEVLDRCEFFIVGRSNDTKLAAEIRAATETLSHLRFYEALPHDQALGLINDADVMICASLDETGPLTLIEAMALGKTIVSTKIGAVGENLIVDEDALFFEPGDAAGLISAIVRLVSDPELLRKLSVNSRRAYEQYFQIDRFGREFTEILEETISAPKRHTQASSFAALAVG
jgi:GT2 family glycosyltransferase/glycosyltransferase involved in cell wall biosynthesis